MKGTIKRIALTAAFALCSTFVCHAEGSDYESLLAKARKYEEQGRYMYALGTYWDAMKADPKKAKDAYYAFGELALTIDDGNPGYGDYDEFTIYDGWLALCKDFEQYWTENCPNSFTFSLRKGELDMATRTATYYVNIGVDTSSKFDALAGFVLSGLKKVRRKSWKGIPEAWPAISVYWEEEKNMMKNGVALFRPIFRRSQYDSLPATMWYLNGYSDNSSLYDVKFNVTDENGKVLLTSGRKRMGSSGGCEFKNVSQDIMKILDSGKARIVPTGVWLEYGQPTQSYYNDSRDWIKPLPEIAQDINKLEFYLPGGDGINTSDKRVVRDAEFYVQDTGVVNVGKFYMMATEVTWGQFSAVTGTTIPKNKSSRRPVDNISWCSAVAYCNLLSERQGLMPCYSIDGSTNYKDWGNNFEASDVECNFRANGWRLPKVEEWQYAARGGKYDENYKYSGSNNLDEVAWYDDNSYHDPQYKISSKGSHDVATKKPNSLGLYDMTGNVCEWCWDTIQKDYKAIVGGGYYSNQKESDILRVERHTTSYGDADLGFRMVRNAEELPEDEASNVPPVPEAKEEPESTTTTAAAMTEAEPETKVKEKKTKKSKKEAEQEVQQEAEPSTDAVADAEDDSEEEDDAEEKSNIFTKVKDKAKEAKDKVVETKDKVKDKVTSKKKKKK